MEHFTCEERLMELGLSSKENGSLMGICPHSDRAELIRGHPGSISVAK